VRRIVFTTHDDILCQLDPRQRQLNADATLPSYQHDTGAFQEKDSESLPAHTTEPSYTANVDSDNNRPRSPEMSLAVVIIEKSYRRALERRNVFPDRRISGLHSHFMECLNHSRNMKWRKDSYRFIYLGLLPHLLLCLNWLIDKAQESKQKIKKRRTTGGSHDDMDDLKDSQTKVKYVFSFCNIPGLHF
jgi:hypothetical protein